MEQYVDENFEIQTRKIEETKAEQVDQKKIWIFYENVGKSQGRGRANKGRTEPV